MRKNDIKKTQLISSILTSLLLYVITYRQYKSDKPFWHLILIVAIFMTASAYTTYREIKNSENK